MVFSAPLLQGRGAGCAVLFQAAPPLGVHMRKFFRSEEGAASAEYVLLLAIMGGAIAFSAASFGGSISTALGHAGSALASADLTGDGAGGSGGNGNGGSGGNGNGGSGGNGNGNGGSGGNGNGNGNGNGKKTEPPVT